MLGTHNIALRKLRSLFLNIGKRRKGRETQNCPNRSFSYNFCHWFSEKYSKFETRYFRIFLFESNWRHAFTHYVSIISVLINLESQRCSLMTLSSEAKNFGWKFCTFFSLIEIWGWLVHFSLTGLLSIYDYILDKWDNPWIC